MVGGPLNLGDCEKPAIFSGRDGGANGFEPPIELLQPNNLG
jgi:hypothetical protein